MVNVINMKDALSFIQHCIDTNQKTYICVTPAHVVMDSQSDKALKDIINKSGLTTPDGMSIVWLLKLYGHSRVSRVYGPDLLMSTCLHGLSYQWRHFFYGGAPGVAKKLINQLEYLFPNIQIAGSYTPPYRELTDEEEKDLITTVKKTRADIVWVGISSPRQEKWMAKMVDLVDANVLIGIGAAFDFVSGNKPQAPLWIQKSGLEWFFRLLREPGRLWKRYIKYPKFILFSMLQLLGVIIYD